MANKHEFQKQIYVYISNDDDPEDRVMMQGLHRKSRRRLQDKSQINQRRSG